MTRLLITVDTEASYGGVRPLGPETRVYGRVGGGTYGIERIMDCCERRGVRATFFVNTLEALHHGEDHVRAVCSLVLGRGHDAQLHVHPIWLGGAFQHKALPRYGYAEQRAAIERAADIFRRATGTEPLAHRAGGLAVNADTLRALDSLGIRCDASVAPGHMAYELGEGLAAPNVPRRLGPILEVPVTTFAQVRLGRWAPRRHFDINADSLSELCFVVERAVEQRVAAISLLMHSFSFLSWNREATECRPEEGEVRKFEQFLDYVAALAARAGGEGEAPAEPSAVARSGSAGASPSEDGSAGASPSQERLSGSFALPGAAQRELRPPGGSPAARQGLEVVTFRELVPRLAAEPSLLDGPDFAPTAGLLRTYWRSWERFGTGWKSKAVALGLPAAAAGAAATVIGLVRWLTS